MDRKLQGNIGEAKAILYYTEVGYEVFLPTTNASDIDLIAVKGSESIRVQVKSSSYMKSQWSYEVKLSTSGGNQSWNRKHKTISEETVDEVFIWCSDDSLWTVPSKVVSGRKSICLGYFNESYMVSGSPRDRPVKSQTKPRDPKIKKCSLDDCESMIGSRSQTCRAHANLGRHSVADYPELETLISMVSSVGFKKAGQALGVSDNAVRKYIRNRGYDPKTLSLIDSKE